MIRLAVVLGIVGVVCSPSLAEEEQKASTATKREDSRQGQRRETNREYDQNKFSVKDPAAFKTEGGQIFSGPQSDEKIPTFSATIIAGEDKGKENDPIAIANGKPHVLFFQDESGVAIRGLFGVAKAISKIDQKTEEDIQVTCLFLADDPDVITSRFGRVFPRLLGMGIDSIAVSEGGRDGPGALGLNRTVSQTVVLARDGKVTRNFVFRQGMLYADPHVMGGVAELVGKDRETVAGWLAEAAKTDERMKMRNDPKATAKRAFRQKLGEFVRAGKITRQEAGELFEAAFPE